MKKNIIAALAVVGTMALFATSAAAWDTSNWGGEDGEVGGTLESTFSVNNLAGADGGLVMTTTENWKTELGGVEVIQQTDGPDQAIAFGSVILGGSGGSFSLNAGLNNGPITSETFVGGTMNIDMNASTFED